MDSLETRNLQRADQTNPVANTDDSDGAPLSIAESFWTDSHFGLKLTLAVMRMGW